VSKVFKAWELRWGYPHLRSQSILSKRFTGKVLRNKELVRAAPFFSAAGSGLVLTFPVCAFYCLGKGYASHRDDFAVENGKALDFGVRSCGGFRNALRSFAPLDKPMAAVPTRALAHEHRSARQFGTQYGH
jgi:hypothetical protein